MNLTLISSKLNALQKVKNIKDLRRVQAYCTTIMRAHCKCYGVGSYILLNLIKSYILKLKNAFTQIRVDVLGVDVVGFSQHPHL